VGDDSTEADTHGNPGGDEVNLVEDVDKVLVRLLLAEVLHNRLAAGAEGVTSVEDVDDDIGRVEHLVQLTPNTTRGTLGVDGLGNKRAGGMEGVRRLLLRLGGSLRRCRRLAELGERADIETRALALRLGAKGVGEGLSVDDVHALVGRLVFVLEQTHRKLVPLKEDRVRVRLVFRERRAEVIKRRLRDYARISEPPSVALTLVSILDNIEEGGTLELFVRWGCGCHIMSVAPGFDVT